MRVRKGLDNFKVALDGVNLQRVDYIQSTGTQYIDTGYKHSHNTRVLADIDFQPTGSWKSPFGSYGVAV